VVVILIGELERIEIPHEDVRLTGGLHLLERRANA
jgi:hypothetical protein